MIFKIKKALILLVFFLACITFLTYTHERLHKEIFEIYGIESEISWLPEGFNSNVFARTSSIGNYENCNERNGCLQLHQTVEIVADMIDVLFYSLFFGFLLIRKVL